MGFGREFALFIRANATILFSILLAFGAIGITYVIRDLWRVVRSRRKEPLLVAPSPLGFESGGGNGSFDAVESRVSLLEERLDFTERLIERRPCPRG